MHTQQACGYGDDQDSVTLEPALRAALGAAAQGADEFLRGFNRVVAVEAEAKPVLTTMREAQGDRFAFVPSDTGTPWRDARRRFIERLQNAAPLLAPSPHLSCPLSFGVLHNLGEPTARGGHLKEFVTLKALRTGFPTPNLGCGPWRFTPESVRVSNTFDISVRGYSVTGGERPGAPPPEVWKTVGCVILARRTMARPDTWRLQGAKWRLLARLLRIFGAVVDDIGDGAEFDRRTARSIKTRSHGLLGQETLGDAVRSAVRWYEVTYENGWGPFLRRDVPRAPGAQ